MKYDLLIKCFIAFCVGAIIYKFISDRCSCNVVEGQFIPSWMEEAVDEAVDGVVDVGRSVEQRVEQGLGVGGAQNTNAANPNNNPNAPNPNNTANPNTTTNNTSDVPMVDIKRFIDNINENMFSKSIKDTIKSVIKAIPTDKFSENDIPDYIDSVSSFEQFGVNSQALDYLELIVIEISNLETSEFKSFIDSFFSPNYCSSPEDLNAYIISMLLLEYYSIKVDSDLTQEYIIISNRLSKYIPKIVEKVQKLNKDCEGQDKKVKSTIMDVMVHRLFKNNNTVINIGSLDSLVNELNKLDRVYGVVILLCITYIVVRFLGMFSMKVEV